MQEDCEPEICYAISNCTAEEDNQLDLREGDEVKVIEKVNDTWWWVELNAGCLGYVPANHLVAESSMDKLHKQVTDAWQDKEYFSSYGHLKIHLEMLSDRPRTMAYKTVIENAKAFIKDKVVLDLGCGTGILSLFCAKIGEARKVYAVEGSDITEHTAKVVQQNKMEDVVEVIRSKGEDLVLAEKVDLLISEWMGTLLLFELMLESVILTRDKVLKSDGVMWPSEAELYLVPCSAEECYKENVQFWEDVYGFDFSPFVLAGQTFRGQQRTSGLPVAQSNIFGRPIYNHVLPEEDTLSDPCSIMTLNLKTLLVKDLEVNESWFNFSIKKSGTLHGFGSWFEVKFGSIPVEYKYKTVTLSTSPSSPLTHWKQDLFVMDTPLNVEPGDTVEGKITITRNKIWRRHLRVAIAFTHAREQCISKEYRKEFMLWR